jgi:signal peptidase I
LASLTEENRELSLSDSSLIGLLREVLEKGSKFDLKVKGSSMSPFIKEGDLVTISPPLATSPGVGRMVAFVQPGAEKLLIHRVLGRRGGTYLIKGDSMEGQGDLVPRENILGRVIRIERNEKEISLGLGPERFLIAFLSRKELLFPLLLPVWKLFRPLLRRWMP